MLYIQDGHGLIAVSVASDCLLPMPPPKVARNYVRTDLCFNGPHWIFAIPESCGFCEPGIGRQAVRCNNIYCLAPKDT